MSASVQTPAGLKTASAVSIQTAAGLKTASAGYVGTAAGAKPFFSSGGGGSGGTTPPPATPPFNVAISQSGSGLGSIAAGQNASANLSAVVSQGSAALAPPFTYAWSVKVGNTSIATVSLSSKTGQSISVSEAGKSTGGTSVNITVVATDANGVQETASLTYTVTVSAPAAPPQPKFETRVSGPTSESMAVGATVDLNYSASTTNGSGSPAAPLTYAWIVTGGGAITPTIISGQGTANIVLQLVANSSTTGEGIAVDCRITDATGYVADSGSTSTGIYLATAAS